MAKKELTQADVDKFVAGYAKQHDVSEAEAKRRIMATGVSRLKTLKKHSEKTAASGGGQKKASKKAAKKAAKKTAKKGTAKKASKKAAKKGAAKKANNKKPAKTSPKATVVEGEEG